MASKNLRLFLIPILFGIINFSQLKPTISEVAYATSSLAKAPAAVAVLYTIAKQNGKEDKFKMLEAMVQTANEVSFRFAKPNARLWYVDDSWLAFDVLRLFKFCKKYLQNKKHLQENDSKKENDSEKDKEQDSDLQEPLTAQEIFPEETLLEDIEEKKEEAKKTEIETIMEEFGLSEQEVYDLLGEDGLSACGLDNPQNLKKESNGKRFNFKDFKLKLKVCFCAILSLVEVGGSTFSSFSNNRLNISKSRDISSIAKGIRYFLLSESGSWEEKIAFVMIIASILKFIYWPPPPPPPAMAHAAYVYPPLHVPAPAPHVPGGPIGGGDGWERDFSSDDSDSDDEPDVAPGLVEEDGEEPGSDSDTEVSDSEEGRALRQRFEKTVIDVNECTICSEDFEEKEKCYLSKNCACKQLYHRKCLNDCLEKNNRCPTCRMKNVEISRHFNYSALQPEPEPKKDM